MTSASSQPSPPPVGTDLLTNENAIEVDLVKNRSSTLEQAPDSEIKPNNANENPPVSIGGSLAENMSGTLGQILEVLKGSTIAGERGKDDNSRFWATYKKVSNEYDDDFLGRAHDDMGIILTFAGLFSAVSSTFIIGMQPNPGDTTNALLVQLIQITVNGPNSVPDISNLSSSTNYSSWTVWAQVFAYASLLLSVLAAFGAVLGKQWLNEYKAVQVQGSLEERGIERQMKLDGVEKFRLQTTLRVFFQMLQLSLLCFCFSLSINMLPQQAVIADIISVYPLFGFGFYAGTIFLSVLCPDSPFRTPGSGLFDKRNIARTSTSTRKIFAKSSAIRWILKTSTNPEIVEVAAAIVPCVQWPPDLDASAVFARLHHNFMACRDREELYVKYGKAMAHLCIQSVKINEGLLAFSRDNTFLSTRSRFIRDAFMAGRDAYDQLKNTQEENAPQKHRASARTALRTMLVHGRSYQLSRPDDEELIWKGDLRWYHGDDREQEFDWLVDYLAGGAEYRTDDEAEGDALLALSAMRGLGSSTKRRSYISSLIRCMGSTRPPRVRHSALRAVSEARQKLAAITSASMPQGVDAQLLNELSRALLTAVRPNDDQTIHNTGPDASLHFDRNYCYIRLIYALTKNEEWCQRLTQDGHLDRCISFVDRVSQQGDSNVGFYLLVIFGHIEMSLGKDLPFSPARGGWRLLVKNQWNSAKYHVGEDGYVDKIPVFVRATRLNLTIWDDHDGVPMEWFAGLAADVHRTLVELQQNQADYLDRGMDQAVIDAALSSMQGLHTELSRMVE